MSLHTLGWNDRLQALFESHRPLGLEPARVAREERDSYRVLHAAGEIPARIAGRLRHQVSSRIDLPAVGDWVALRPSDGDGPALIEAVLPRTGVFVRKRAGDKTEAQVVAANIDVVLVMMGLDGDFNPRRIERYLAAAWDGGAAPVVVLNKADLVADPQALVAEVEDVSPGVPVVCISASTGAGLDALERWLVPGNTVALLGSSGVGKSTLANALLGEERQATHEVRADDSRGRHTTTHRELFLLPCGAVLLDTPGMRELQLWADESTLIDTFPDIEALAATCHFRDCRHDSEPACAVRAAIERGALATERFESWRKLQRELRWLAGKQDVRIRIEKAAKWRAISRSRRFHPKVRRSR